MNDISTLGALRNRWWIIPLLGVLGALLAAIPTPSRVADQTATTRYKATHTMLLSSDGTGTDLAVSPRQVSLFATTGDVPKRVKEQIGYAGSAAELATQVEVKFDQTTLALTFTSTQESADRAVLVADTFAEVTSSFIAERQDNLHNDRLAASMTRLDDLTSKLDEITRKLAITPDDAELLAQRDAISRQYSVAFEQNDVLQEQNSLLVFTTLASAEAVPVGSSGLGAPESRLSRALLGGAVGVLLAIGLAMLLGRIDRRVRTAEQVERITGLRPRVLIPRGRDESALTRVVTPERHDMLADAYRTLRNVIGFVNSTLPPVDRARVVLVVSAGASEGKTTLVSNLAATMAETGQRTIAINTDFRRPQLTNRLTDGPVRLPYALKDLASAKPYQLLRKTKIPNVALLDLSSLGVPDELARATAAIVPRLATVSDAIVIDSSPVSATAEVLELVPQADVIVVVVRLGRSDVRAIERTMATLRDLTKAPLLLVLVGVEQSRNYYNYYYAGGEGTPSDGISRRRPSLRQRVTKRPAPRSEPKP